MIRFEHGGGGFAALAGVLVVDIQRIAGRGLQAELFGGDFDDFGIRGGRRFAEVAEDHFAVTVGDLLPRSEHDVVKGLLEVELRHRRHGGAVAALDHDFAHRRNEFRIAVHQVVVAQHLGIGCERAARHGGERDQGFHLGGFRRHEIILQRVFQAFFQLDDLVVVDAQIVLGAAESVPHGQDVRLAGAARDRSQGQVNLAGAAIESCAVGYYAATGGFMRVERHRDIMADQFPRHLDGIVDFLGAGSAGGVFETDGRERNARIQNLAQYGFVERGGMAFASGGQFHHGNGDFMPEAGFVNAVAAVDEVFHVVQRVEVTDRGDAVFLQELGVKFDDVAGLGVKAYHVDAAGQGLQIGAGTGRLAEIIHHLERIFVGIEVCRLEQGAAAGFEMFDPRRCRFFHDRQEILGKYSGPKDGLEAIPKRC